MAAYKEIRFQKLIDEFGQPEVVTIWAHPKKDRVFMKLVKGARIFTLIQKPTGNKKDFGLIGFHPQPFATYLSFPKRLKTREDVIVIGIKYDLLKRDSSKVAGTAVQALPPKRTKPAPVRKSFEVTIRRRGSLEVKITVVAFNSAEAKGLALAEVKLQEFMLQPEETENNVISAKEN